MCGSPHKMGPQLPYPLFFMHALPNALADEWTNEACSVSKYLGSYIHDSSMIFFLFMLFGSESSNSCIFNIRRAEVCNGKLNEDN